jgi:hypothetical protein
MLFSWLDCEKKVFLAKENIFSSIAKFGFELCDLNERSFASC